MQTLKTSNKKKIKYGSGLGQKVNIESFCFSSGES